MMAQNKSTICKSGEGTVQEPTNKFYLSNFNKDPDALSTDFKNMSSTIGEDIQRGELNFSPFERLTPLSNEQVEIKPAVLFQKDDMGQTRSPYSKRKVPNTAPDPFSLSHIKLEQEYQNKISQTKDKLNDGKICSMEKNGQLELPNSRFGLLYGTYENDAEVYHMNQVMKMKSMQIDNEVSSNDSNQEVINKKHNDS